MSAPVLGVDFGTSNSAVGVSKGGVPHLIEIEPGETTLPTALFFDFDRRTTLYGHAAAKALIAGEYGRYMRGLKSILGTSLMREKRRLLNERLDFVEITARFLSHLKARAEAATGHVFERVVSGRPVRFHDKHPERDVQAEADLREAYSAAGFKEVRFLHEPEAAARAYAASLSPGTVAMVVDIGGGTSDFTVFEAGTSGISVRASMGLRKGGTDFDRHLSIAHVMPHLGRGAEIRRAFGRETDLAPNKIFNDLATWAHIPFLYAPEPRRQARDLARMAVEPEKFTRLSKVLEDELGHDLAFAVEAGKIEANSGAGDIDLNMIETGLSVPLSTAAMACTLARGRTRHRGRGPGLR